MLRTVKDRRVTGAAIIVTSDGFLLAERSAVDDDSEVVLLDGRTMRPVRVASENNTNLTLLKIAANDLVPARPADQSVAVGDTVFVAGYDGSGSIVNRVTGHVRAVSPLPGISTTIPPLIETDIPLAGSLGGGLLLDSAGSMVGLVVMPRDREDGMVRALSEPYLIVWFDRWRDSLARLTGDSAHWPALTIPGLLSIHYPSDWSAKTDSGDPNDFRAELVPSDPDAALRIAVSVQSSDPLDDPMAFATKEFGDKKDAAIWGAVQYGGFNGVRVVLNQEGARIDTVYLFGSGRQLAFSMTSGYGSDDTLPQAERAAALYEATLRSITPIPPVAQ